MQPSKAVLIDEFDDHIDPDSVNGRFIDVQVEGEADSFNVFGKGDTGWKALERAFTEGPKSSLSIK